MASKICSKCFRRVTMHNVIAKYCPWGCGSLENEPISKDVETTSYAELVLEIEEIKNRVQTIGAVPIIDSSGQVKLF